MLRSVALMVTVALVGCDRAGSTALPPDGARPATGTRQATLIDPTVDEGGIIIGNSLSTRALLFNALSTNHTASDALTQNPLTTETFATVGPLKDALRDPAARELFTYLVGCALPKGASVAWSDDTASYTFEGTAGLCPEWATLTSGTRLSNACQELVSACLLARNNAFGYHVPLSVRGDDREDPNLAAGNTFSAFDWRDRTTAVASFDACTSPQYGVARNCGFSPGEVHACVPGEAVTVAAGAPPADACETAPPLGEVTSGDMVLRACEGVSGCDNPSRLADGTTVWPLDSSEGYECRNYLYKPTLSFTCPPSGVFNVMAAPYGSTGSGSVALGELGSAPAHEQAAYPVREGAFFGNLFDTGSLQYEVTFTYGQQKISPSPSTGPEVVYKNMYACTDARYLYPSEQALGRICTEGHCAAESLGRCQELCTADDANDGEFRACNGGGDTWKLGLTTFLEEPCAVTPPFMPKACAWK